MRDSHPPHIVGTIVTQLDASEQKLALEAEPCSPAPQIGADTKIGQAEVCFNTSMTGYQEILTDPAYRGQIVTDDLPARCTA